MFPYDLHQDAPIQKALVTMDDIQATFSKKLWVFELWVLEYIGGHNFLCRNMYLHLIVIIGVDNNNCNLQLPPKPIIPWERWLVCHPFLQKLSLDWCILMKVMGEHSLTSVASERH